MDPQTNLYLHYYRAQAGGNLPAYHGLRRGPQNGAGLGDILRGIWRTVFPIAARGASTFLNETLKARDASGATNAGWATAAKAAIAPTAQTMLSKALEKVAAAIAPSDAQKGTGKRKRKRKAHHRQPPAPPPGTAPWQSGGRRKRKKHHVAYKRKHSAGGKHRKQKSKRIKFLNF